MFPFPDILGVSPPWPTLTGRTPPGSFLGHPGLSRLPPPLTPSIYLASHFPLPPGLSYLPACLHALSLPPCPLPSTPLPPAAAVGLICDACLCALTEIYMPALTAAGILPLPANASAASYPALISESTDVITACTSAFLTPALAAGINIVGLARLPTQCNFTAGSGGLTAITRDHLHSL